MIQITKFIEGDYTEEEFEQISERLIIAKLDRDKKRAWAKELKEKYGVEKEAQKSNLFIRKSNIWILSIAASLVLIISAVFFFPFSSSSNYMQAVNQHIEELNIMGDQSVLRKGKQEIVILRQEATLAYVNKKYKESIVFLEKVIDSEFVKGQDYFYLGLCYLQKQNAEPQKSIEFLQQSIILDELKEESLWALSLAYLKNEEKERAIQTLTGIVESKTYKNIEAAELLKKIK